MKIQSVYVTMLLVAVLSACGKIVYESYDDYPVYTGNDLELTYTPKASYFRVWSPAADQVKLMIFNDGHDGPVARMEEMKRAENGTWKLKVEGDLKGMFYTFQVKVNDRWMAETPGMWVKAVGVNGKRAAIIDMAETNPEGWDDYQRPPMGNPTDAVIYEVHMRDFSVYPGSGIANKGKFLAFTEKGTTNAAGQATGIDHLVELGITHVHLLPSYDYASIDETRLEDNKYNWGYDPLNYNVPEGGYSTDPYNPLVRIREFKEMVMALHKAGIRVIMDVVYNHTYTGADSHLNLLVPGYFYRFNADLSWSNASGCGNETASERPMMRKFIVESVLHWVNEYKIDGFRFDLMGIHDIETMNAVRDALHAVDPTILIYGEGWLADSSPLPEEIRATKINARQMDNIAVFSDDIRDALKGSWMEPNVPGFVSGTPGLEEAVKFGVVGGAEHPQVDPTQSVHTGAFYVNHPTQIINYVSCHDDLCLVDKLRAARPDGATDAELKRFNKLAQTVVFTSQGIPFIYAGEELYRDKKGDHNSYQSPDAINQINWDQKTTHEDVFVYYRNLIRLRQQHPAFRMPTREMVQQHLSFLDMSQNPNVVAYTISGNANGDPAREILVILNGNRKPVKVAIPQNNWKVLAHDAMINPDGMGTVMGPEMWIGASSATILAVF
jgi:pullulanase